jgi:catechol 2,3-dioxygenase-like lactoylglutathione lyase family enzyme
MSQAENHHRINYIEFAATDVARAKQFYAAVFGWSFQDWGPDYIGFEAATAGASGRALLLGFEGDGERDCCGRRRDRCAHIRISRRAEVPLF